MVLPQKTRGERVLSRLTPIAGALLLSTLLSASGQAEEIRWDMASTYPSTLPQLGTLGRRLQDRIAVVSDGDIELTFQEPGSVVLAPEVFDAVSAGTVQAGWSSPGYWAGRDPALALFAAIPFGPRAAEYLAWYYFAGGRGLFEEIYHSYNIHGVICGVAAPEASGWFREPIDQPADLDGKSIRFLGLGARVLEKLGASTTILAAGEIHDALEAGEIDGTEFSMPAIDLNLGFHEVADYYYFPGWHQQSTLFDLMINLDAWNALGETQRAQIEAVCGDSVRYGLAEGDAIQVAALRELRDDHGVEVRRFSPETIEALEKAWNEVAADLSADNENFARVWASLSSFREDYAVWGDVGYLD